MEIEKKISEINEGKGGADKVKKNETTKTKLIIGLEQIKPRAKICCRVAVAE